MLGFLSGARSLEQSAAAGAYTARAGDLIRQANVWRIDAAVAATFLLLVVLIVLGSAWQWWQLIRGTRPLALRESEFVPLGPVDVASA